LLASARFIGVAGDPRAARQHGITPALDMPAFPRAHCPVPVGPDAGTGLIDPQEQRALAARHYQPFKLPGHVPAYPAHPGARYFDVQPLREEYAGEQVAGKVWPGQVDYLADAQQRAPYRVGFDNGRMIDAGGKPIDTRNAPGGEGIFVMDLDGSIYLSTTPQVGKFHHSSFLAGDTIAAGGTMRIVDGRLERVTPLTGHHRTLPQQMDQLDRELQRQGVSTYELHRTPPPPRRSTLQWLQNIVTLTGSVVMIGTQVIDKFQAHKLKRQLAAIDGKLQQLSPDALKLLRIAALEGGRFRSETAQTTMGRSEAALQAPTQELAAAGLLGADAQHNGLVLGRVQQRMPPAERESLEQALIPRRLAGLSADELKLARLFVLQNGRLVPEIARGVMKLGDDQIARMTRGLVDDVFGREGTRYRLTSQAILENLSNNQRKKLEAEIKRHAPQG
jgi:hypothetical protein